MQMNVSAIPAFDDNYIWVIDNQHDCIVVDPGQAPGVLEFIAQHQLRLAAILITHHHGDHTGGVRDILAQHECPVYGPENSRFDGITHPVHEGNTVHIDALALEFAVLECPGHTLDHIAFYAQPWLFCGDTLFSAGCGRMFEGQPAQFLASLDKLAALPAETEVYCAHEYTAANLSFANAVEPDNQAIHQHQAWVARKRQHEQMTLPSRLALELEINPFLRTRVNSVKQAAQAHAEHALTSPTDVFASLRAWKDNF